MTTLMPMICPDCGSTDRATVPDPNGIHHAKEVCADCGRYFRWVPRPMDRDRADNFVMPFGKYKDHTLREIVEDAHDSAYLLWLLENGSSVKGSMREAIKMVLGTTNDA